MARFLQSLRRALGLIPSKPVPTFARSIDTNFSFFQEGDRVIVHGKTPSLTKPLRRGQKTDVRRGTLEHNSIIGQRVRDQVKAHKGPDYRLSLPTLDEYVSMTPRLVTPIYSADANLIVSLLDIHVTPPAEGTQEGQPLEILESGTGHGSLTLHLARAIQAANSTPPPLPQSSQIQYLQGRPIRPGTDADKTGSKPTSTDEQPAEPISAETQAQQQWDAWRAQRRAVIHTVDVSPKFSAHAEKIVRGFRRGIYAGNVDFYVGHVENWITEQKKQRAAPTSLFSGSGKVDPFLSYAILDMPSAHLRIPHVAPILKRDGLLTVFMPSVTQVGDCVELIRRESLPFILEKVVELGSGISSGRLWDVRLAVKKSRADPSSWTESADSVDADRDVVSETDVESAPAAPAPEEGSKEEDSVLVCRPKVGTRIVGGGFIGVWRRIEDAPMQ
ncbi:tRNA (adenine-N(1)-)-methyltransferase [Aspergillus clavatus NRRL 1]|uniref:tRNA (adenine(58)-N(1))-methyltransferase catalytic subunit TRM61 n=1 Tax=Aspergillus clavatus (strain ATCC 1007 / CBS 513.65 / DSM 816 / NCTC 3887 / NRRL 1 / QM 1276 / 107) TaxID=344612 RepID=A1CIJ5_ASPCL|nr:tRNA (adenine-N(1)-)-methyltransferase [Aspergillus clavatus NRRL 1]EAW10700.1 tRNA (adenine-N(1)-)-methyltransferase [Aspergillus clavatus NRRL 1]